MDSGGGRTVVPINLYFLFIYLFIYLFIAVIYNTINNSL